MSNSNPPKSDLEKRLRSIVEAIELNTRNDNSNTFAVEEIKAAIKDAGYIQKINDGFEKGHKAGYRMAELEYMAVGYVGHELKPGMLTGEEWYQRFISELDKIAAMGEIYKDLTNNGLATLAAKRAAGIDEL